MFNVAYTFAISVVYLLIRLIVISKFDIENEFFFIIGTISVIALYFLKELPLLFFSIKKSFNQRIIAYLLSAVITTLLYTKFYINFSELEATLFKEVLLLSLELHIVAVILYYLPVEIYKSIGRKPLIPHKKTV
ncbi:hypothetical protein [Psychrobacillus psychrodurans]|uniref:Regulatory protein YrvL n=1 Tax=Psychrobacillus psychrodurans TaxID=126157 RepID=A0A9X3RAJ8_9BACI|nr:hypothetical protein [Psychrobacillus psychrodurans]MCZ8533132.1 hypothetical protein [Psychrobacillus psychrodurans]